MSGGHFDYDQYKIQNIIESIQHIINNNKVEKTKKELDAETWHSEDWFEKYPEDKLHYNYSEEVINHFKKGVKVLEIAKVYAQRIDYLLSGDDGEDSFITRLNNELDKI